MSNTLVKLIVNSSPPVAEDSRLPVVRGGDGRSGITGTTSPFVAGGPIGAGLINTVIADPGVAAITLSPDQLFGAMLSFAPLANNLQVNFPTAASIISYLGSDLVRVRPGLTATTGAALPAQPYTTNGQLYESFDLYINFFDADSTLQLGAANAMNSTTKTFFYGQGFTANATSVTIAANTRRFLHYKVIIASSTPGAEVVWIIPVAE